MTEYSPTNYHLTLSNLNVFICEYEIANDEDTLNMVGPIEVCKVHGNNSKWGPEHGEHRPCITVDPW